MLIAYLCIMKSETLYIKIELAFKEQGFNLNGIWDKINYTAKMLLCDRMVESGKWMELPEEVFCSDQVVL